MDILSNMRHSGKRFTQKFIHGRIILFFAVLFFAVNSWCGCYSTNKLFGGSLSINVSCYEGSSCSQRPCASTLVCSENGCDPIFYTSGSYYVGLNNSAYPLCNDKGGCGLYNAGVNVCYYTMFCTTACEADSVECLSRGDGWQWMGCDQGCVESIESSSGGGGDCDTTQLHHANQSCIDQGGEPTYTLTPYPECELAGSCDGVSDTVYRCNNTTLESNTYGERPVAQLYTCTNSGTDNESCERTNTLNGTCQDWGFCREGEPNCIVNNTEPDPSGTPRMPCKRSGGSTTSSGRCYYQCVDGSSKSCTPTSTEYVAGAVWVGVCPDSPPSSCYPSLSSNSSAPSSSNSSGWSSSSSPIINDTLDDGVNVDYSRILAAIHDTLHRANEQREILSSWDVNFMRPVLNSVQNIEDYSLNSWQDVSGINSKISLYQNEGFNLTFDVRQDLDSARLLLDEINKYLRNDSIKTYSTDTIYNPLLRDIRDALDSTGSVDSTYQLLKPFFKDSGQYDSPITRFLESFSSNFGRSSEDTAFCSSYYSCLRGGGRDCVSRFPNATSRCIEGGSPFDGVINIEMGILETLWDAIFGADSTPIPYDDDSDSVDVLPPGYSSASAELRRANDSLGSFNLGITLDSMRSMLDSARRMNNDTTKIQPDSLWLDSSQVVQYVDHILLPSGTGTDCFVCRADLGTFGGLSDTSLKIVIDFSDFGGYNWCEIIRAVVKIATLVTCISLTLGSWAAAFGYNSKNDA